MCVYVYLIYISTNVATNQHVTCSFVSVLV